MLGFLLSFVIRFSGGFELGNEDGAEPGRDRDQVGAGPPPDDFRLLEF